MSNQPTPITDDEIRSVLYRMAAHVSFFAEPRTPDPKAAAFADVLMSAVRPAGPEFATDAPPEEFVALSPVDYLTVAHCLNQLRGLTIQNKSTLGLYCFELVEQALQALSNRTAHPRF